MIGRAWHEAHRMPEKATLAQRIAWHREHALHCACRPMPPKIAAWLDQNPSPLAGEGGAEGDG